MDKITEIDGEPVGMDRLWKGEVLHSIGMHVVTEREDVPGFARHFGGARGVRTKLYREAIIGLASQAGSSHR